MSKFSDIEKEIKERRDREIKEIAEAHPLPKWREAENGGWECDDVDQQSFAMTCQLTYGFDLIEFDLWLSELEPDQYKDMLLLDRYLAFKDRRAGNTYDLEHPLRGRLVNLNLQKFWYEREGALLPLACHGRSFRDTQAAKGKLRWANPHDDLKNGIIAMLAKRKDVLDDPLPPNELWGPFFAELEDKGLHPVDDGDDAYLWDGGRITYDAFRKQVARNR